MKKIISIILVSILLIASIYSTVYANGVEVTKEKLKEAFEKISNSEESQMSIEITDDKIIVQNLEDSITADFNYTLEGKTEFSVDMIFTKDMTYEEYTEEYDKSSLPFLGFIGVANIAGQDVFNAMFYFLASMMNDEDFKETAGEKFEEGFNNIQFGTKTITEENFTDAISIMEKELAKEVFIKDELYTYSVKKVSQTENELVARTTIVVNTEADFAVIEEGMNEFTNAMSNMITIDFNNIIINQENVDNTIANIDKIPQSGRGFDIVDMLQVVIILAIVAIISLMTYGKINKTRG